MRGNFSKIKRNWKIILGLVIILTGIFIWAYFNFLKPKGNNVYQGEISEPKPTTEIPSISPSPTQTEEVSIEELYKTALKFYQEKKYQEAESAYKQILLKESQNINALLGLGNTYRDWGKVDLAIKQYEKVIDIDSHNITAYLNLAQVYKNQGKIDKAKEVLKQGLVKNPNNFELQNSLDILEITPHSEEEAE